MGLVVAQECSHFWSMCVQAVISDRNEEGKRSDVVEQYEFQRKCSIVI